MQIFRIFSAWIICRKGACPRVLSLAETKTDWIHWSRTVQLFAQMVPHRLNVKNWIWLNILGCLRTKLSSEAFSSPLLFRGRGWEKRAWVGREPRNNWLPITPSLLRGERGWKQLKTKTEKHKQTTEHPQKLDCTSWSCCLPVSVWFCLSENTEVYQ